MNKILVPTTFNAADANAFRFAVQLAMRYDWSLRLAHVSPIFIAMNESPIIAPIFVPRDATEAALEHFFQSILLTQEEKAFLEKISFEKVALDGSPTSALLDFAEREKVSLIVAAGSQKSGFEHLFFGSVSSDLARLADCPVLLVPENSVFRGFERVVFAADLKAIKPVFLDRAVALAVRFGSFLHFLHIGDDVIDDMELKTQLFDQLSKNGRQQIGWEYNFLEDSDIESSLTDWLLENPAQLLILSTHHRGFFEAIGHTSVTAGMAQNPLIPILVLHEEDAATSDETVSLKGLRTAGV